MNTKLTLTLEKEVIERAKKYASSQGRSLSEMVENYFLHLTHVEHERAVVDSSLSPRLSRLKGMIKVDEDFDLEKELNRAKTAKHG